MKRYIFQLAYDLNDAVIKWVAVNRNGSIVGFRNPPVRDFSYGEWIDSTDGSTGYIIDYTAWETSVREVADLKHNPLGTYRKKVQEKNVEEYKLKQKGKK